MIEVEIKSGGVDGLSVTIHSVYFDTYEQACEFICKVKDIEYDVKDGDVEK